MDKQDVEMGRVFPDGVWKVVLIGSLSKSVQLNQRISSLQIGGVSMHYFSSPRKRMLW